MGNKAKYGACIYSDQAKQLNIHGNNFTDNNASILVNSIYYKNTDKGGVQIKDNYFKSLKEQEIEVFDYPKKVDLMEISYYQPNETIGKVKIEKINDTYYVINDFLNVENRLYNFTYRFIDQNGTPINTKYFLDKTYYLMIQTFEGQKKIY